VSARRRSSAASAAIAYERMAAGRRSAIAEPHEPHEPPDIDPGSGHGAVEISAREVPRPPRLTKVIAAAYATYQHTVDVALRDLLAEVVIAMGVDQSFRTEISREDAEQVLEALRYVREVRS
jgi:hypothetical protein